MAMSKTQEFANATIRGAAWTYVTFYGGKFMVFISTVILARLLTKEDFGIFGFALAATSFLEVLQDLGVGPALIYQRKSDEVADTAFWLGIGISSCLFVLTWLIAPWFGTFFGDPRAVPVTRALAFSFPLFALSNVHDILLQKELAWGHKFIPETSKQFSKGFLSILFALLGFGFWSLIIGQLGGRVVAAFAYWRTIRWRPKFHFAREHARSLLSYGSNIVGVNLFGILMANADYFLIFRYLGAAALGAYTVAFRIPELIIMQFCNVVGAVIFPVYAKMRDDPDALTRGFAVTMQYVALVTLPLGLGLAMVAEPFVLTVFGERWVDSIPVMRAISIYAMLFSLSYNAGDVYKAQGRPEVLTKLAPVRAVVLIVGFWYAITQVGTIEAVGWAHALAALIAGAVNLVVAARMLHLPLMGVVAALRPAVVGSSLMTLAVLGTLSLVAGAAPVVQLVSSISVGALTYALALWLLQRDVLLGAGVTLRAAMKRA